jgi:hypothetical protein
VSEPLTGSDPCEEFRFLGFVFGTADVPEVAEGTEAAYLLERFIGSGLGFPGVEVADGVVEGVGKDLESVVGDEVEHNRVLVLHQRAVRVGFPGTVLQLPLDAQLQVSGEESAAAMLDGGDGFDVQIFGAPGPVEDEREETFPGDSDGGAVEAHLAGEAARINCHRSGAPLIGLRGTRMWCLHR